MDDDPVLSKVTVAMLKHLGFEATACSDGAEAVKLYKCSQDAGLSFSAVITDVEVPGGVGGEETAKLILAIDPKAILIVTSGNHGHHVMTNHLSHGFRCALPKPYNIKELSAALKKCLR